MSEAVKFVLNGGRLDREHAKAIFTDAFAGNSDPVALGALLTALAMRGETSEEIAGAAEAMRGRMEPFVHNYEDAIDTAGTGGDNLGTFNLSTAAALVACGAGARVIKHGNRAVSSRCGSADLLEAAGVRTVIAPAAARTCLEAVGITFLFAPRYHPAMRSAAKVRKALGVRTIFNLIGPLANPGNVKRQVLGVPDPRYLSIHADALQRLGAERALVVHGSGGADELTLGSANQAVRVGDWGGAPPTAYTPDHFGLMSVSVDALAGADARHNLHELYNVLTGKHGPLRDAVLINATAALQVAGIGEDPKESFARAEESIDAGKAMHVLKEWIRVSEVVA